VLLDSPASIFIAANSNAQDPEKSWQKALMSVLNCVVAAQSRCGSFEKTAI
jgi:hypothetical protein